MTFKILTDDTNRVVHRSVLRPTTDDRFKNQRVRFVPDSEDEPISTPPPDSDCPRQRRPPLKSDQGLSCVPRPKQNRRQHRRHQFPTPPPTPDPTSTDLGEVTSLNIDDDDPDPDPTGTMDDVAPNLPPLHTRVYDIESPDDDVLPDPTPTTGTHTQHPPCTRSKVDRLMFTSHSVISPLHHVVQALLLGLALHSTYDLITPFCPPVELHPVDINPDPTQFTLQPLTAPESRKLQELLHLDMLSDSMNPNPDSHIWKCITITDHKLCTRDKNDIHTKVKVIWSNGEDTWIRLDALRLQDPYPLITYAVKKRLTKHPDWQWTIDFLQDDGFTGAGLQGKH